MASRNQEVKESPCKKFLQWKTITDDNGVIKGGNFVYYDKAKEKNVEVPIPFEFALLNDDCITFKGYDDKKKQGVWSNEVDGNKGGIVTLRNKSGELHKFDSKNWKMEKDKVEGMGAKYTKSVYIAVKNVVNEWEIWNLQLSGASLTGAVDLESPKEEEKTHGWFNFTKMNKTKLFSNMLCVDTFVIKKKGVNRFTVPMYSLGQVVTTEDNTILAKLTDELDEYLEYYLKGTIAPPSED